MDTINFNIRALTSAIKRSEVYREYKKQEKILLQNPELMERVDQFRAQNFQLQEEESREKLFEDIEQMNRESAELRHIPEVNAYLDAELAMCRLLQSVAKGIAEGIDMHVPEL